MTQDPQLRILPDPQTAANECSKFVLDTLAVALKTAPFATLAISGGSTPKLLFAELARAEFDWSNVHIFWVDERCVPADSEDRLEAAADRDRQWNVASRAPQYAGPAAGHAHDGIVAAWRHRRAGRCGCGTARPPHRAMRGRLQPPPGSATAGRCHLGCLV